MALISLWNMKPLKDALETVRGQALLQFGSYLEVTSTVENLNRPRRLEVLFEIWKG